MRFGKCLIARLFFIEIYIYLNLGSSASGQISYMNEYYNCDKFVHASKSGKSTHAIKLLTHHLNKRIMPYNNKKRKSR